MLNPLDKIIEYDMTSIEAKAYKVSLLWKILCKKEFPNEWFAREKYGDPRKSFLFKHCYKLVNETQGSIRDNDYKLYILAQLQIMKNISNGTVHAMISPEILSGPKSWRRWEMWKSRYDKIEKQQIKNSADVKVLANADKSIIKKEIDRSKEFLFKQFGPQPNLGQIKESIENRNMVGWVTMQKISPYYVLMSPYVLKISKNFEKEFSFDLSVYRAAITPEIEVYFKKEFFYEY